ncbi:MAG TPA: SRPBCC family protein [Acidimicrobiales bacterium]|nr:SRPBCC family protein [Acidimicrobiales bacterium]
MSDRVETQVGSDSVSASAVVDAPPAEVFDFVRRPANHPVISGDSSVKGAVSGPEVLSLGDRFGMNMRIGLPYRITNKVVEFEPDRRIAWCHFSGHRWRWQIEDAGDGRSKVTETFDMSTAKLPPVLKLLGYPRSHEKNVASSVANVVAHFASGRD